MNQFLTENVSLFLYSLVKCHRPHSIVEVGCGYSTSFIAKALKEIKEEDISHIPTSILVDNYTQFTGKSYDPYFVTIDSDRRPDVDGVNYLNMEVSEFLNSQNYALDMVWLDFGPSSKKEYHYYFNEFFSRLNPGGFIIIHSTVSNYIARLFLTELKLQAKTRNDIEIMSFVEPHKKEQNSFTVIKKEADYLIYTTNP